MHRFYIPEVTGDTCVLGEEESKHCIRVLRLGQNDPVEITDGKGSLFEAIIENANPKACLLKITGHQKETALSWDLIIAVAPTKNMTRMEWLVEKLTEIGFTKLIPVECHTSERKVLKTDRLYKIALEAIKQSKRLYLPKIEELISFKAFIDECKHYPGQKFIAHCNDSQRTPLSSVYKKGGNAIILVGPEGDFTKEEVELAIINGFTPVSLNEKTLRTETAALVAAISMQALNS